MNEIWPKDPGLDAERRRHESLAASMKAVEKQIDRDGEYIPNRHDGQPDEDCVNCGKRTRRGVEGLCPYCQYVMGVVNAPIEARR